MKLSLSTLARPEWKVHQGRKRVPGTVDLLQQVSGRTRTLARIGVWATVILIPNVPVAYGNILLRGESLAEVTSITGARVVNVSIVEGKHGKCFSFSEAESALQLPVKKAINAEQGTIEMWVKNRNFEVVPVEGQRAKRFLFGSYYGSEQYFMAGLQYYTRTPKLRFYSSKLDENKKLQVGMICFDPPDHGWKADQWHHLAFTWGRSRIKMYVDGALVQEAEAPGPVGKGWRTTLQIGACATSNPRRSVHSFNGLIDEIAILTRERTAEEIATDFKYGYKFPEDAAAVEPRSDAVISAVRTAAPPEVDGMLSDACWKHAAKASSFHVFKKGDTPVPADQQTTAFVAMDDENFYVAFKCMFSDMSELVTRDGDNLWHDDHVELFLSPFGQRDRLFQICVNSAGNKLVDNYVEGSRSSGSSTIDESWQSSARYAAFIESDHYGVEMAIPIRALTRSRFAEDWGINFCRVGRGYSTWSSRIKAGFVEPESFGRLKGVGDKLAGSNIEVGDFAIGDIAFLESSLSCEIRNISATKRSLRLDFSAKDTRRQHVAEATRAVDLASGETKVVSIPYRLSTRGRITYRLDIDEPSRKRTLWTTGDRATLIPDAVEIALIDPHYRKTIFEKHPPPSVKGTVRLNVPSPDAISAVALVLHSPRGDEINRVRLTAAREMPFEFDIKDFAAFGGYRLTAVARCAGVKEEKAETTVRRVKSVKGESFVDKQGFLVVDGKRFFPLGGYGIGSIPIERGWISEDNLYGFNTAVYGAPNYMKAIEAIDFKYRCVKEGDWDRLRTRLGTGDLAKPSFMGFTIADEPLGGGNISLENLRQAYETIADADPHHPVTLVSNGSGRAKLHRPHVDYLLLDIYPMYSRQPLVTMYHEVKRAKAYLWPRPIIAVPEGLPAPAPYSYPIPTRYEQVEVLAFLAIAGGARGVVWFNTRYATEEIFGWMKTVAGEKITPLVPVLLTDDLTEEAVASDDAVKTLVKRYEDDYYLLAVNSKDETLTDVVITLPEAWKDVSHGEEFYARSPIAMEGREVSYTYKPYETKVFRYISRKTLNAVLSR